MDLHRADTNIFFNIANINDNTDGYRSQCYITDNLPGFHDVLLYTRLPVRFPIELRVSKHGHFTVNRSVLSIGCPGCGASFSLQHRLQPMSGRIGQRAMTPAEADAAS